MNTAAVAVARTRWRMSVEARALVLVNAVILAFGLAVLYSASVYEAMQAGHSGSFFLFQQIQGVAAGIVLFAIAAKFDSDKLRRLAWIIMGVAIVLMIATIMPGMRATYGSRRFLRGAGIQPSEFAKLAVVIWSAMLVERKGEDGLRRLSKGILPFLIVIGVLDLIAVLEPDYSVAIHFTLLMCVVLYAGGARIGHFVFLGVASIPAMWAVVQSSSYAKARVVAFLNPDAAASADKIYQLAQSMVAAGSGGLFGVGFGEGRQQLGYVLFPYTDFIGSVIAEEWGFIGIGFMTVLFSLYGWLGFRIARNAPNKFQRLVAIGITVNMLVTAYVHLGVVLGLLPTTGLTLPFVSFGRSNLLVSFIGTGILCNIGSQKERVEAVPATSPMVPVTVR